MHIEYIHASQVFDDNNNGYEYGINYIDNDNEIADCEWYRTEEERDREAATTSYESIK